MVCLPKTIGGKYKRNACLCCRIAVSLCIPYVNRMLQAISFYHQPDIFVFVFSGISVAFCICDVRFQSGLTQKKSI